MPYHHEGYGGYHANALMDNEVMDNGKKFSTGNHPVEVGLPMLHLLNAGFKIDVVTPTGAPVMFEEWAMPGIQSK